MIDATLQELWSVKDKLAQEHAYNLDSLVSYLRENIHSLKRVQSKFHQSTNLFLHSPQ